MNNILLPFATKGMHLGVVYLGKSDRNKILYHLFVKSTVMQTDLHIQYEC